MHSLDDTEEANVDGEAGIRYGGGGRCNARA